MQSNQQFTNSSSIRRIISTGLVILAFASVLNQSQVVAQKIKFPYTAQVVADNTFARAGAGETWFPTQRLAAGTIVTVHRHDAGGWFQISPPEGSFSWVPQRYLSQTGPGQAEVSEDNVVAYVGSDFGEETTVWQRSLSKGTKVTVLENRRLFTLSGEQAMAKILPPIKEYRWVPGSAVVPVDENIRRQMDNNPYQTPSNAVRKDPQLADRNATTQPGTIDVPELPANSQLARLKQIRESQQQLAEIDKRFREMITGNPELWDLDAIESAYQQLQQSVDYKPVAGQIDLRYPAIERYRRKLAELNDFKRLTSQTEQRDAQLVAQMSARPAGIPVPPPATPAATILERGVQQSNPNMVVQNVVSPELEAFSQFAVSHGGLSDSDPAFTADELAWSEAALATPPEDFVADGSLMIPNESATSNSSDFVTPASFSHSPADQTTNSPTFADPSDSTTNHPPGNQPAAAWPDTSAIPNAALALPRNRYVGAGIVQRATSGKPDAPFLLMTPAGRILAYLKPDKGVNLEPYVGQAVGLHGSRWFEEEIQSDYIEVNGLEVVRIKR